MTFPITTARPPLRPGIMPVKPGSWVVTPPRIRPYTPWWRYGPGYFPYPYQKIPFLFAGVPSPLPPQSQFKRPPAPQKLYPTPMSEANVKRYCDGLYTPYCENTNDRRYCEYYRNFCSGPMEPLPAVSGKFFNPYTVGGVMTIGQPNIRPAPTQPSTPAPYQSGAWMLHGRPKVEIPYWALGGAKRRRSGGYAWWWPAPAYSPWGYPWGWPWNSALYGIAPMTVPMPRSVPERPPAPQKLYGKTLTKEEAKRYCRTLFKPYCEESTDYAYCQHYGDFCSKHVAA